MRLLTFTTLLASLLLCQQTLGQDPLVELPAELKVQPGRMVRVTAKANGKTIRWLNPDPVRADLIEGGDNGRWAIFSAPVAGTYRIFAYTALGDVPSQPAMCVVTVGTPGPGPEPKPPDPKPPDPKPPEPEPVTGLQVLIVYESADLPKMSAAQQAILYSKTLRDYLDSKCVVGPDGKTKDWRIWDKDVDASAEAKGWQDLLKRPKASVPWLILNSSKGIVHEGALPGSVADTMTLLQKYAPMGGK